MYTKNTPYALCSVKPWFQMSTPERSLIHPVTMPVVLGPGTKMPDLG